MQSTRLLCRVTISGVLVFSPLFITSVALSAPRTTTTTLKALSTFLTQLENKHPLFQINQAEQQAAKARTQAASQPLYNPELELDTERVGFNTNEVDRITLGVNQTIDWYDKRSARKNIAMTAEQVTRHEIKADQQQLIARAFSALADYQVQREIISTHQKRLSLAKQVLAQATRRYQGGDISKLELEQIRLDQTQTQLILNQSTTQLKTYEQALIAIVGIKHKVWPALPYAPPVMQARKINDTQLLNNLPLLKAEATRVAVARSTMRLRVREQKADPTIGLRAGGENSDKVIGLTVSIPLNVRNNLRAEVTEAKANIRRAESKLDNTKHQLRTRLQAAAQTYQLNYSSWQSWQKVAGSSLQTQRQLLLRLWKSGELSTSDYLVQLNQIKQAEINHVELKGNVWKAWFNWLATSNQFKAWLTGRIK